MRYSSPDMAFALLPVALKGESAAFAGKLYLNGNFVTGVYYQYEKGATPSLIAADAWAFSISKSKTATKIAYEMGDYLYLANLNGSNEELLSRNSQYPALSPDGNFLAYSRYNDVGDHGQIVLMDLATKTVVSNLSQNAFGFARNAAWSPDSRYIVYEMEDSIYIIDLETDITTGLNTATGYRSNPTWSPDGKKIAFSYDGDIYTVKSDGSERTNITNTPDAREAEPAWYN